MTPCKAHYYNINTYPLRSITSFEADHFLSLKIICLKTDFHRNKISKWKELAIASNCDIAENFPTPTGQVWVCNFQCWTRLHSLSYLKLYFETSATLLFLQLVSSFCANNQGNRFNSVSSAFENVWQIGSKLKAEESTFKVSIDDLFTKIRIWFFPKFSLVITFFLSA